MLGVTVRQREILQMLYDFTQDRGFPPSIREIGDYFDISSLRGVTVHLDALERKALIRRLHTARSICVLPAAHDVLGLTGAAPNGDGVSHETLKAARAAMETAVKSLVRNIDGWTQIAGQVTLGRHVRSAAEERVADNRRARRELVQMLEKIATD